MFQGSVKGVSRNFQGGFCRVSKRGGEMGEQESGAEFDKLPYLEDEK